MDTQIARIKQKIAARGLRLNPCASLARVEGFESAHGVVLPDAYRRFILEIGDGGDGPPHYGVYGLQQRRPDYMGERWNRLPNIKKPFPFTQKWIWESRQGDIPSPEGTKPEVNFGSICIGDEGCARTWHLIVAGPERGIMWDFADVGIIPSWPKMDFLTWYEEWLDRPPGRLRR